MTVAVVDPPANVPLAPLAGAVKVTDTPLRRLLLASLTVAASAVPKLAFCAALCGVPAVAVMIAAAEPVPDPVPTRLAVWGLLPAVSVTVKVPLRVPDADGR